VKRRRHTPEQVIGKLREADRMLGEGKTRVGGSSAGEVPTAAGEGPVVAVSGRWALEAAGGARYAGSDVAQLVDAPAPRPGRLLAV